MKKRIENILEKFNVVADANNKVIAEEIFNDIEFDFIEYTNFLNENYKIFGEDWIRISDDRIIYNPTEIFIDYLNNRK